VPSGNHPGLEESDCAALMSAALERGNYELALSVFEAMGSVGLSRASAAASASLSSVDEFAAGWFWPPASLRTVAALVLGLARSLRVADAIRCVRFMSRSVSARVVCLSVCAWRRRSCLAGGSLHTAVLVEIFADGDG
jgi:pentatricopeptide repeat protein